MMRKLQKLGKSLMLPVACLPVAGILIDNIPILFALGVAIGMQSRKILVVASGADKAEIVRDAFTGPVTPQVPASILQLHGDVILVGDQDALSLL